MKLCKFENIVRQNPWLGERIVGWLSLGSLEDASKDDPRRITLVDRLLKEVVREELDFIAFRPWASLDLMLGTTPHEEAAQLPGRRSVQFTVFYHIEGELSHSRQHFVIPGEGVSIRSSIEEIRTSEGTEAYASGKAFIVDCVVRDDVLSLETGKGPISMQVYICPAGSGLHLTPPLRKDKMDPYEAEARRAYLEHRPLPPIQPGLVLNVPA
jgi:hypothetical protein